MISLISRLLMASDDHRRLLLGQTMKKVQNRQLFDIFLQRLRNATLRLNKGTQTEGDAERALTRNQQKQKQQKRLCVVRSSELREVNERAIENKKRGINRRPRRGSML